MSRCKYCNKEILWYHDDYEERWIPKEKEWFSDSLEDAPTHNCRARALRCRYCNRPIEWLETKNGKWIPLEPDSDETHWKYCIRGNKR